MANSSTFIDVPSNERASDHLQSSFAPTSPVYINMGIRKQTDNANSTKPITTATTTTIDSPLSHSYADYALPSTTAQRQNHSHRSNHLKNRNRYPYIPYNERRSASRHAKDTSDSAISEQLSPDSRQDRTTTSRIENKREDEEEEVHRASKSFWVILRLVFFVLAIEFMEAVEIALTVPILTSLHVDESYYSMVWLISPIIGFFLQPIVGMWSDTCKCRWGRRRPFILAFAIGAYIGITLLLNSPDLGAFFGDLPASDTVIPIRSVILIATGVTLLDFCGDSANSPIRAYLIDSTNPADQERGLILHAILGGFGGGLGFFVGTIEWPLIPMFQKDGGEFSIIFYIATFVCIVCTISTLTSVREDALISISNDSDSVKKSNDGDDDDEEETEIELDERRPLISSRRQSSSAHKTMRPIKNKKNKYLTGVNKQEGFVEIDPATGGHIPYDHVGQGTNEDVALKTFESSHQSEAMQMSNSDRHNSSYMQSQDFDAELQQKAKLVKLGFMRRSISVDSDIDDEKNNVTIKSMIVSMIRMPARLWKLMICQVIGSIGYYATHLYFTDFMAVEVYNGTIEHGPDDPAYERFRLGVTMGCWGLFVFSISGAIYAFCLERWLVHRVSLKFLYFIGYLIYGIGCIVNFFFHHVAVNIAMCFTFGILVVSLKTLPFQMLAQFHADDTYRNRDGSKRGIGIDCSLLNSCLFLGELIVAASLSPLLKITGVNYCMIVAAGLTFIGNICMFFLFYFKN